MRGGDAIFPRLGYSRLDGVTSDHWTDVEELTWEPQFYRYVRDAFAPLGLAIDAWAPEYTPGPGREFPVLVVNDLYEKWKGTVRFRLLRGDRPLAEKMLSCEIPAPGKSKVDVCDRHSPSARALSGRGGLVEPGSRTGVQLARLRRSGEVKAFLLRIRVRASRRRLKRPLSQCLAFLPLAVPGLGKFT